MKNKEIAIFIILIVIAIGIITILSFEESDVIVVEDSFNENLKIGRAHV